MRKTLNYVNTRYYKKTVVASLFRKVCGEIKLNSNQGRFPLSLGYKGTFTAYPIEPWLGALYIIQYSFYQYNDNV